MHKAAKQFISYSRYRGQANSTEKIGRIRDEMAEAATRDAFIELMRARFEPAYDDTPDEVVLAVARRLYADGKLKQESENAQADFEHA